MYAFRVEASLYIENCPKSAATVLSKKTYQALFVFWEISLFFLSLFHLEENTELLEAGHRWEGEPGHLLTEQDPLVSPWCNTTFRWRSKQLLTKPTTAARCRHILNKIYKFAQEQECPAVEEDRAASVESPPADQTMKLGSHRHQVPDQKPRPAPLFPAFSPFRVFPQMSWETKHFVLGKRFSRRSRRESLRFGLDPARHFVWFGGRAAS